MEILKAQLAVTRIVDGNETPIDSQEVELVLKNIPGAWAVHRKDADAQRPDQWGVGDCRFSAVADWYGRNFGKKLEPKGVCEIALKTLLERMDHKQVQELEKAILAQLGFPK